MRFITEFELDSPFNEKTLLQYKAHAKLQLGAFISNCFGWEERDEEYSVRTSKRNIRCLKLEIEAFPMDKWIEFKKRFMDALPDYDSVSRSRLINAIAELEQFPHTDVNEIKKG